MHVFMLANAIFKQDSEKHAMLQGWQYCGMTVVPMCYVVNVIHAQIYIRHVSVTGTTYSNTPIWQIATSCKCLLSPLGHPGKA